MLKIHIIIPTHNRRALAERCLERVFAQTAIEAMSVTVVNDGSGDGTAGMLAASFPAARVIEGDGALWWTGAVAKALDALRPSFAANDFFLLVNDDTLLREDTVEVLVRESTRAGRAGMAPIAVDASSGRAISTGWGPGSGAILNDFEKARTVLREHNGLYEVHTLFGRCSLFPVEILERVRNYDAASFPHYYGDVDFGLRARKEGFHLFVTDATCIEVVENQAATGSHFTFRQGPQDFASVVENMTSIRSIENVPITWRYMRRHFRDRAGRNTASIAWRSLRQWRPIYKALGLSPLPQRGAAHSAQTQDEPRTATKAPLDRARPRMRQLLAPIFEAAFYLVYQTVRGSYRLVQWARRRGVARDGQPKKP
ncbi:MAG: glycosyltransferase [Methyloceanibacter sp.]|nr:glycosyltransferase [Methyloceanibacter sp.]